MRLGWLELKDFRNHVQTRLEDIPEGLIVAVGANGEGKTNLLEGMHALYAVGSPRSASTEPLVRRGVEAAYVRGEVESSGGRARSM
jgi:DNA replication and repair protein RecF